MQQNFWSKLPKPILALAPMANVTDAAFRQMFARYGKPDVIFTEFVSVEGLLSSGRERLLVDFWFGQNEHPIVAQIFGNQPDQFEKVANLIHKLGFDGIDINMGCPDKSVEKQGAGAALMKNPERAVEILRAAKQGARGLPISVKTRLGYKTNEIETWLPILLKEDLAALTVHLRTRREMSDVAAHWELAADIVTLRDRMAPQTIILGNGDVETVADARKKVKETGIDGVMIGRGAFGRPWFFSKNTPSLAERLAIMAEHAELFQKLYKSDSKKAEGKLKNFDLMKKHFQAYATGFGGAKELRVRLMKTENAFQVRELTQNFIQKLE
ncbi:MAG: tRNA-dihydrouridine synthase [Patescibacteria group bacterium]